MALTARLQFGDNSTKTYPKEFLVENCRCHFSRHCDLAYPDTDARCERVELTVVAPGKDDLTLYDWYINGEPMNGRVIFDLTPSVKAIHQPAIGELSFESAYCFSIAEDYKLGSRTRRLIRLSFVADTISIDNVEFHNPYNQQNQ